MRVAVTGAGASGVFRVGSFEEALKKRFSHKVLDGLTVPAEGLNSDIHGSAEYRAHLIAVLARRAVEAATAKALHWPFPAFPGAVDLTFSTDLPQVLLANVKSKTALEMMSAGVPLVLTFVKELAAT